MVRQQEKAPHRRLDDMRREEDRRMAEREQVAIQRSSSATPPPIAARRRQPCEPVAMGAGSRRSFDFVCVCVWVSRVPCARPSHSVECKVAET